MRGDNVEYVPRWVWDKDATWTAADPLTVEPLSDPLTSADKRRDGILLALAVLVIVALLGYAIGRAS